MRPITALFFLASALLWASPPVAAADWHLLPGANDPAYVPEMVVALKGGRMDPHVVDVQAGTAYGIELSLNSPLLGTPVGKIRDQFSWNRLDQDGLKLDTVEWNPHYMVEIARDTWIGAGPGLGYVMADSDRGSSADMWAVQFGVSAYTLRENVYLGAESRFQWTQGDAVGLGTSGADNWLSMIKLGYRF